ncbi:MAG: protein disulfide oxidoreductase [bacterium]|jgi:glutaredoxin-like protein
MFISKQDRQEIKKQVGNLNKPTEVLLFSQKISCEYCPDTEQLLKELTETLDNLKLVVYNPLVDVDLANKYGINKELPAILLRTEKDYNFKFLGIPAGYEFTWLLNSILMVSNNQLPISDRTVASIKELDNMLKNNQAILELWVFVTPTCPYCPIMTISSTAFSVVSENIKAINVEVSEFQDYAVKYNIMGVPKTVLKLITKDQKVFEDSIEGALPENKFVEFIKHFVDHQLNPLHKH